MRYYDFDEGQRQLTIRALAVQGLTTPGFQAASREAAGKLEGAAMFDELTKLLEDTVKPEART